MIRRAFWVSLGLGAGVTFGLLMARWFHRKTRALAPSNLVRLAGLILQDVADILLQAAKEFRLGIEERGGVSKAAADGVVTRIAGRRRTG
jgi:hypothetical protein